MARGCWNAQELGWMKADTMAQLLHYDRKRIAKRRAGSMTLWVHEKVPRTPRGRLKVIWMLDAALSTRRRAPRSANPAFRVTDSAVR